jgi:hypothetical protein
VASLPGVALAALALRLRTETMQWILGTAFLLLIFVLNAILIWDIA